MANPPPPYSNITGISRSVMKDNAQETISAYNGVARPSELVVDQLTQDLYVGNTNGNLNLVAFGSGVTNPTSFNPQFTDASGTTAGAVATGSYVVIGPLCYFHVYVDFATCTDFGTQQYQITLPFPAFQTIRIAGGTLHQTSGTGSPALFHIAGITDVAVSDTVHKLYYSGSTTDLAWKYNTPVNGTNTGSHFDISGIYLMDP
jgi:hypothetical protein